MASSLVQRFYQRVTKRILAAFVIFLAASVLFVTLADEVVEDETQYFDESVLHFMHTLSSPWLNSFFVYATQLGGVLMVGLATIFISSRLWRHKRRAASLLMLLGVGGAVGLNLLLKLIFYRARPDLWQQLITEQTYSFPSGHAMASLALTLCIIIIAWNKPRWRIWGVIVGVAYSLLIAVSRLYLGVHYPTDIIAGWLVAAAWVTLVYVIIAVSRPDNRPVVEALAAESS